MKISRQAGFADLLVIIVVVIVIAAAGGAVVAYRSHQSAAKTADTKTVTSPTPTPNPTAGWKTYTDAANGFSVKYPGTWQQLSTASLGVSLPIFSNQSSLTAATADAIFMMPDSEPGTNLETCYKKTYSGSYTYTTSPAKLGNVPGQLYTVNPTGSAPRYGYGYLASTGGRCYTVAIIAGSAAARDALAPTAALIAASATISAK